LPNLSEHILRKRVEEKDKRKRRRRRNKRARARDKGMRGHDPTYPYKSSLS